MTCEKCESDEIAPILDVEMYESPSTRGNPYRRECLSCGHYNGWSARREWTSDDRRLLLIDGDVQTADEYGDTDYTAEEDDQNTFRCPADGCEAINQGYPDACHSCGAPYNW